MNSTSSRVPSNQHQASDVDTSNQVSKEENTALKLGKKIPEPSRRDEIVSCAHQLAHSSPEVLYRSILNQGFYWQDLKKDCTSKYLSCTECQMVNIAREGFHPQQSVTAKRPLDHIAMDLAGPFVDPPMHCKFVLIMVDVFSRYMWFRPLSTKTAHEVSVNLFHIFCEFGHPKIVQSDNGGEFVDELLEHLALLYSFTHRKTTTYHPQSNGVAELAVRSFLDLSRK